MAWVEKIYRCSECGEEYDDWDDARECCPDWS